MADGGSVNAKPVKDITKSLGMISPTECCACCVHTSDGSIKKNFAE